MIRTARVLWALSVSNLVFGCSASAPEEEELIEIASIGDLVQLTACLPDGSDPACPAGQFHAHCWNSVTEVVTREQILADDVCVPNSVRFELDGVPIGKMRTDLIDAVQWVSFGRTLGYSTHLGAVGNLSTWVVGITHITGTPFWYDCANGGGGHFDFSTVTVPADVALPAAWRGLPHRFFQYCGSPDPRERPDIVLSKSMSIFTENPDRFAGLYEIVVEGRGPRLGQTLRAYGDFDVDPIATQ